MVFLNDQDQYRSSPAWKPPGSFSDWSWTKQGVLIAARKASAQLTSSPTLIGFPPQPGNKTLSPGWTEIGATVPSLLGAPGPTAMTVASGRGEVVAEEGRKMPVAVFCARQRGKKGQRGTHGLGLEALDQNTVQKRLYGADGLEGGSLVGQEMYQHGGTDRRARGSRIGRSGLAWRGTRLATFCTVVSGGLSSSPLLSQFTNSMERRGKWSDDDRH